MIIGIDMGHGLDGYPNSGATGLISESNETRVIGNKVMVLLKQQGHKVINCTVDKPSSNSNSINTRVAKANAQKLDLFISIHFNSGGGQGAEVLTYKGKYLVQADRVLKNMDKLKLRNRGIKDALTSKGEPVAVVYKTNAPAMLIETCFVDTKTDAELYKANIDKIASAIAYGITGEDIKNNIQGNDEDMIADTVKIAACGYNPIAARMIEETKLLQGVVGLNKNGIATEELVKKLPELNGTEQRGVVTVMQRILILKGFLGVKSDTGIIGPACKAAIEKFKLSIGIPNSNVLIDMLTWRKLLEY